MYLTQFLTNSCTAPLIQAIVMVYRNKCLAGSYE